MDKKLKLNSIINACYRMLNMLFPLISSMYVSRIILSEGVGRVSMAQNVASYFALAASLGIPQYGTKKIGSVQNSLEERSQVFGELFSINFFSSLLCSIAYYAMIFYHPYFQENIELYAIFGILIVLNCLNVDWFYQGIEEYGYIAVRSLAIKFLSVVALFVFVRSKEDCMAYALILCIATVGNYIFNMVHIRSYIGRNLRHLELRKHLKPVFILLASVISMEIYTLLDSTMVGIWCGDADLGCYTNSVRTVRLVYGVFNAMVAVYLPRLSLYYKENRKKEFCGVASNGLKMILSFSIPSTVGIFLLADKIIPVLFGGSFSDAVPTLRILSILVVVLDVAAFSGHTMLIAANCENRILIATCSGAVVNFILNLILIRAIGFNGAAIASVIAELLVTVILLLSARRIVHYEIGKTFVWSMIVSTLLLCAVVLGVRYMQLSALPELILSVGIGGSLYVFASYFMKNDIIVGMVNAFRNKIKRV